MTLIAAFRCDINGFPGVIICADSQESYGNYRVTVDKIKPRDANQYDLVVGGAGNIAPLIDGLANTIERYVKTWSADLSEEKARSILEWKVGRYFRGQVNSYPAELREKELEFIVCVRKKSSRDIYLWRVSSSCIEAIEDHDLIGWDEPLYKYEAKRLYRKEYATEVDAITLGVHLLSVGKATATSIDAPFQVIGIGKDRLWVEPQDKVEALAQKISKVNDALSRLIISIPNFRLPNEIFDSKIKGFESDLLGLRQEVRNYVITPEPAHLKLTGHAPTLKVKSQAKKPKPAKQPKKS